MSKKLLSVMLAFFCILAVPASASPRPESSGTKCKEQPLLAHYSGNYHKVRDSHGKRAPGRNIRKYGLSNKRKSKCKQIRKSLKVLRRMRFPGNTLLVGGQPHVPPSGAQTLHAGGTLASIAACESGGDPTAVSPDGLYKGKYQFDDGTWESVGGSGSANEATEAEQDMRAAMLYEQRGAQPWPVCGR